MTKTIDRLRTNFHKVYLRLLNKLPFVMQHKLIRLGLMQLAQNSNQALNSIRELYVQKLLQCLELQELCFIQIGANDGQMCDQIFSHVVRSRWKGVLIEPIPYYFEQLKRNYAGKQDLFFENIAIGVDSSNSLVLYRIDEKVINTHFINETWLHGQASFQKENVENEIRKWFKGKDKQMLLESIVDEEVTSMTIKQLMDKHRLNEIDLLQIDTQGYDYDIILSLDFERDKIKMINFENQFETSKQKACKQKLLKAGYVLCPHGRDDILALLVK